MEFVILFLHIVIACMIIVLVLLQRGQSEVGADFGAGKLSQTVFGSAGAASFLTRLTQWLVFIFFSTSLALAYFIQERTSGFLGDLQSQEQPIEQPMPGEIETQKTESSDVPTLPKKTE